MPRLAVILNPNARRTGPDKRRAERLRRLVGDLGTVWATRSLDELFAVLRRVFALEVTHVIADGGDGSLHWVLNATHRAALQLGHSALPAFIPTRSGTVDFVARRAGVRGRGERLIERVVQRLRDGEPLRETRLDTLLITGEHASSAERLPFERLGFALAAGGVGQRFFDAYYGAGARGPRAVARIMAEGVAYSAAQRLNAPLPAGLRGSARALFEPTPARVTVDGVELGTVLHGAIHAGAFDLTLAGFVRVFPLAQPAGTLHFQAGGITPTEMVRALPRLLLGRPLQGPNLLEAAGAHMRVEALPGTTLSPIVDGERLELVRWLEVRRGPIVRIASP